MFIKLKVIEVDALSRLAGYKEAILAAGKVKNDFIEIPSMMYTILRTQYPQVRPSGCCGAKTVSISEPPKPFKPNFPPLTEELQNLANSAAQVLVDASRGNGIVADDDTQKARMEICRQCPNFHNDRCKICGCQLKAKIMLKALSCPDDPPRW